MSKRTPIMIADLQEVIFMPVPGDHDPTGTLYDLVFKNRVIATLPIPFHDAEAMIRIMYDVSKLIKLGMAIAEDRSNPPPVRLPENVH